MVTQLNPLDSNLESCLSLHRLHSSIAPDMEAWPSVSGKGGLDKERETSIMYGKLGVGLVGNGGITCRN